jgi:hypothetical protein
MLAKIAFICLIFLSTASVSADENSDKLIMTPLGVGPLNRNTKFDHLEVQNLLSGFKVKNSTSATEGEEFPILQVYDKKTLLLTIYPNRASDNKTIRSIVIKNNVVKNNQGPKLGAAFKEVYPSLENGNCRTAIEEIAGYVFCYAPTSKNIVYLFAGKWDGPDKAMPPYDILQNWKIISIAWVKEDVGTYDSWYLQ